MSVLKRFFKLKETYIGIAAALAFQLIFFTVWLTAYDGILDRTDQLKIGIVNEDEQVGNTITKTMTNRSDIKIETATTLAKAKKAMDQHELNMVVHIPADLSGQIQQGKAASLYAYINQATPALSKQMMESIAIQMTKAINQQIKLKQEKQIGKQISTGISEKTANPASGKIAATAIQTYQQTLPEEAISLNIHKTNHVEGFAASMIPLMVVIASFIGAMVMSMQLHFAANLLKQTFSKWQIYVTRMTINIAVSILLSLMTILLLQIFDVTLQESLFTMWWFQSLLFFSFLTITHTFITVLGNAGLLLNIIAMAVQLVSSGAMVPRELLSNFYTAIGNLLPATYGADGYFNLVFGGSTLGADATKLLLITGVLLMAGVIATLFKKHASTKNDQAQLTA